MRKLILSSLLLIGFAFTIQAQEVGIRFGDVAGNDVAIDAVFSAGEFSRIHADLSFGSGLGAECLWDFVYRDLGNSDLKWYAGVGASTVIDDDFFLGASGEIGLEYRFDGAPIVVGADWRPTFWIVEETDFHAGGFGVNVRYVF